MGTDDPAERALLSGLIKIAAGFVHAVRGNPLGVRTNLRGARERLALAPGAPTADRLGLDLSALLAAVDDRLAAAERLLDLPPAVRPQAAEAPPHDVAGPPAATPRPPLPILPIRLPIGAHVDNAGRP